MKQIKIVLVFSMSVLLSATPLLSSAEGIKGVTLTPAKTMIDFTKKPQKNESTKLGGRNKMNTLAAKKKQQGAKPGKGQSNKQSMYGDIIMGGMPLDNFND